MLAFFGLLLGEQFLVVDIGQHVGTCLADIAVAVLGAGGRGESALRDEGVTGPCVHLAVCGSLCGHIDLGLESPDAFGRHDLHDGRARAFVGVLQRGAAGDPAAPDEADSYSKSCTRCCALKQSSN